MASVNNWLGFSLSPQQLHSQPQPPHPHHQDNSQNSVVSRLGFNSDVISGTDVSAGECFDLSSDSTLPSLNHLPPPFGILEAFNRNTQSQDWNMKGMSMNSEETNYESSSKLSIVMGSSSCSSNQNNKLENNNQQEPKLENFLGVSTNYNTAGNNNGGEYTIYPNCTLQLPSEQAYIRSGEGGGGGVGLNNTSIGLSMIKNWLRNNPTPTHHHHHHQQQQQQPVDKNDESEGLDASNNNSVTLTGAQTLSLSMSTGNGATCGGGGGGGGGESSAIISDQNQLNGSDGSSQAGAMDIVPRKSIDTFGQRTSIYRGVTRHRWTGRYEAHLWDNSCRREGQTRKGRQVYLGGYDKEEKAARAYDLAALKYWGTTTTTNFPISNYEKELEEMKHMTRQEYVASLRRKSSGFSRGASIYRGVTRYRRDVRKYLYKHHQHGRWQARIGRVAGNKDLYLGTFSTQEEAAEAYDIAAIKFRGLNAVTNFEINRYDVKSILESSTLPIGGAAKRLKDAEQQQAHEIITTDLTNRLPDAQNISDGISSYHHAWPTIAFQQSQTPYGLPYYGGGGGGGGGGGRIWCKQEQEFHHHLQLGNNNTHNFFQPSSSSLNNLINLEESSSMEHSSGSNSVMYNGGGGGEFGGNNSGLLMAIGNGFGGESEVKAIGYDSTVFGSSSVSDPYNQRNLYYLSQQSNPGSACNNWVPTAVPTATLASRPNSMAVCHGAQTFTVWNDT